MKPRDPGILYLAGVRVWDLCSLTKSFSDAISRRSFLAADVTLGAWRTHHIASEFSSQLGLPGPRVHCLSRLSQKSDKLAGRSRIGRLIDRQTMGDCVALEAFRLASEVNV